MLTTGAPTDSNIADFFTKALQGPDKFDTFREFLMGTQRFNGDRPTWLAGPYGAPKKRDMDMTGED